MPMKTCSLKRIQLEKYQKHTLPTSHIEKIYCIRICPNSSFVLVSIQLTMFYVDIQ